jgi:hypothetical protein
MMNRCHMMLTLFTRTILGSRMTTAEIPDNFTTLLGSVITN